MPIFTEVCRYPHASVNVEIPGQLSHDPIRSELHLPFQAHFHVDMGTNVWYYLDRNTCSIRKMEGLP